MTTRGATPTHRSISAAALIAVLVVGVATPSAVATTTYRYWSYWIVDAGTSPEWGYASEGAGTRVPADGSVEGWRFGLAGQVSDIKPSVEPDFESICAGTERQDDTKRVGVVIDPGTVDESPDGEQPGALVATCVVVDKSMPPDWRSRKPSPTCEWSPVSCVESTVIRRASARPWSRSLLLPARMTHRRRNPTRSTTSIKSMLHPQLVDSPDEPPTQETSPTTPLAAALTVSVIAVVGFAAVAPLSTGGDAMTAPTVDDRARVTPLCPTSHETTGPDGCTRWPGGRGLSVSQSRPA